MSLLKRLISNDRKENMVLTNSQIIGLLKEDFNINTANLHELEVDIYLSIMKKFLKDWPQWDEFDQRVNKLRTKDDNVESNKLLEEYYPVFKDYLSAMLDITKPIVKESLNSIKEKKKKNNNNDDLIMEVHSSRSQLNKLFYNKPVTHLNDTILNIIDVTPSKITLEVLTLQAILNWWFVEVQVNLKNLIYTRRTKHVFNHVLVNRKLGNPKISKTPLDTNLYQNIQKGTLTTHVLKTEIIDIVHDIHKITTYPPAKENLKMQEVLKTVLNIFLKDIELLPTIVPIPSIYKRKWNKYSYIRYLYENVDSAAEDPESKHDLRLQETIVPEYELTIRKVDTESKLQHIIAGRATPVVQVECKLCMLRFSGNDMAVNLMNHFTSLHLNEPNWSCVKCKREFAMADLCQNWWYHKC